MEEMIYCIKSRMAPPRRTAITAPDTLCFNIACPFAFTTNVTRSINAFIFDVTSVTLPVILKECHHL